MARPKLQREPLPEVVQNYLDAVASEGKSSNTVMAYRTDLEGFVKHVESVGSTVETVTASEVGTYIGTFTNSRTMARRLTVLRSFFSYLVNNQVRSDNPSVLIRYPNLPKPTPKFVTSDELNVLITTAKAQNTVEGVRIAAILEIIANVGFNVSEVVTMEVNDARIGSFPQSVQNAIAEYVNVRAQFMNEEAVTQNWLFPSRYSESGHLTRQQTANLIKEVAAVSGIGNVSPRMLRHSKAVAMLQNGSSITEVRDALGIKDNSSIHNTYGQFTTKPTV